MKANHKNLQKNQINYCKNPICVIEYLHIK